MSDLLIFDRHDNLLCVLSNEAEGACPFWDAPFKEILNNGSFFAFSTLGNHPDSIYIAEENQVAFLDKDENFRLFVMREPEYIDGINGPQIRMICEAAVLELKEEIIKDVRPQNVNLNNALIRALNGTRWKVGQTVDLGLNSTNYYYISALEAIFKIIDVWGGEFRDRVTVEDNKITGRYIDIVARRGADTGKLWDIDKDIINITKQIKSYPKTALYGRGASLEIEDDEGNHTGGYTRKINFADVEWKVSSGDPVDKPKGQEWVGDPSALSIHGRLNENGTKRHRFGIFEDGNIDDPSELLMATWNKLQEVKIPLVHYEIDVLLLEEQTGYEHEKVRLGDTSIVLDRSFTRPIEVEERVIVFEYDIANPDDSGIVELGNYIDLYFEENKLSDLEKTINDKEGIWNKGGGPVTDSKIENVTPGKTLNVIASGGFQNILVEWDFVNTISIANYEVYASQIQGFTPDASNLVFRGKISTYSHKAESNQQWYFRVRAVNTHGVAGELSDEAMGQTARIISDDILFGPEIAEKLRELDLIANGSIGLDKIKQEALDSIQQDARLYTDAEIKATEVSLMSELANKTGFDYVDGKLFLVNEELLNKVDNGVYQNKIFQIDNSLDGLSLRAQNVEADVIELNGEVGNALSQISAVDIKANKISTSVSELKSEFDGMVIGTRNLILNSSFRNGEKWGGITRFTNGPQGMRAAEISRSGYEGTQRSTLYQTTALRGKTLVEEGKTYTLSGWFYIDSSIPLDSDSTSILVRKYRTGSTQVNDFINVIIRLSDYQYDKWYYFEKTGTVPAGYVGNDQVALALGKNGKIAVSMLKLEEGTKASSWTPAPEDIESRVSSAETKIDQTAYDLTFKASQTSVDSLTGRMVDAESSIKLMSDEIGFKVDRDGIISAINLLPGTVQIEARLIDLKGDVYITDGRTVISDLAVTNAALANASISRAKLQDAVIGNAQIENLAVTNGKIANLAVDDAKISNVSIDKLKAGTIDTSKIKIYGGNTIEYTEINGAHLGIYGQFSRTFANGSATYNAFVDSYGGTFRAGITSKRVGSTNYPGVFRWTALTDKGLTTQRAVHSGSSDYNGARFIDFYADETLTGDVQGLGMHIYSGQSMTIESNYALDLKHSMDYMTNLTSGGLRVNANNTGLVLKRTTRYDTNQGQSIQFKSWDDTTMAIIDQPNNNYNLHMYTKFGDYIILGARQEIHIKDTEGNNWRNVVASGFKRNDGYSAYINGTGTGNTKGAGDVSGTNEDGVPVLMSSAMRIRNSDTNMFLAVASNGEVYVTDLHGRGGSPIGYRPIRASAFNQQSSRQYKTNIEKLDNIGIATINSLTVVSYDLKMDIENNIYNPQVGLISEDSASVATIDGKGIDIYKLSSYNTKAIQELAEEVNWLKIENQYLRKRIEKLEAVNAA